MSVASEEDERAKLEKELCDAQQEYKALIMVNEDIENENKAQDKLITSRELFLQTLKEKQAAEIVQLEMEEQCLLEKYSHTIASEESFLKSLTNKYDRVKDIERENEQLRESLKEMNESIASETMNHAMKMHQVNKEMKGLRQHMESTLKRELSTVDLIYQRQAFTALEDRKKKAMLRNSQLKDEIALQGVGINNLTTRLSRQEAGYALCMNDIRKMNRKARNLRDKLGILATMKVSQSKMINEINAEEAELSASKQKYEMHHLSPPLISTLEKEIKEIQSSILSEHDLIECWTSRLHVLQDLYLEIKPVDPKEKRGSFNSSIFKIGFVDLHSYFERTGDSLIDKKKPVRRAKHNNHHHAAGSSNHQDKNGKHNYHDNNEDGTEGMKLSEILRFIRGNEDLIRIFECVEGKESNLVNDSSKHTPHHAQPSFQNMVAWVTVEILSLWIASEVDKQKSNQAAVDLEFEKMISSLNDICNTTQFDVDFQVNSYTSELEDVAQKIELLQSVNFESLDSIPETMEMPKGLPHIRSTIAPIMEYDSSDYSETESESSSSQVSSTAMTTRLRSSVPRLPNSRSSSGLILTSNSSSRLDGNYSEVDSLGGSSNHQSESERSDPLLSDDEREKLMASIEELSEQIKNLSSSSSTSQLSRIEDGPWYRKSTPPSRLPKLDPRLLTLRRSVADKGPPDKDIVEMNQLLQLSSETIGPPVARPKLSPKDWTSKTSFSSESHLRPSQSAPVFSLDSSSISDEKAETRDPLSASGRMLKSSSNISIVHNTLHPSKPLKIPISLKKKIRSLDQ